MTSIPDRNVFLIRLYLVVTGLLFGRSFSAVEQVRLYFSVMSNGKFSGPLKIKHATMAKSIKRRSGNVVASLFRRFTVLRLHPPPIQEQPPTMAAAASASIEVRISVLSCACLFQCMRNADLFQFSFFICDGSCRCTHVTVDPPMRISNHIMCWFSSIPPKLTPYIH